MSEILQDIDFDNLIDESATTYTPSDLYDDDLYKQNINCFDSFYTIINKLYYKFKYFVLFYIQ